MQSSSTSFYTRHGAPIVPPQGAVVRPRRGVFAIARAQNSILLIWPEFSLDHFTLPGGGIEDGESADEGMAREWAEETGLAFDLGNPLNEFRHTRGFYAEDYNEYWVYDQTFRLYDFPHAVSDAKTRNPEGDLMGWEKIEGLHKLPINRAHWCGIVKLIPELEMASA